MLLISRGLSLLALGLLSNTAWARETATEEWKFRIASYLWGSAIDGNVAHERLPVDLHASMSFGDVWDNLDVGAMGAFEAQKGRFGVFSDGMLAKLSTTVHAPLAGAALPVKLKARTATGLVAFQYGWLESDNGYLDLVAGVRIWSARTRLAYSIPIPVPPPVPQQYSGSQQERWADLQVGFKGRREFANRTFVGGWALAGKGESDLSTDVMLLAGYSVNERLSIIAGYRWLSTDYETSSGFQFDTTMQGPGMGLEYQF